jgi:hypothetical protein
MSNLLSLLRAPLPPQRVKLAKFLALNTRSKGAVTFKRGPSHRLLFGRQRARTQAAFGMCCGACQCAVLRVDDVNTAIAKLVESALLMLVRRQKSDTLAELQRGRETFSRETRTSG